MIGISAGSLRAKALSILGRDKERLNHLGIDEVTVELIELVQPEVEANEVERLFGRVVRVSSQVS